MILNIRPKIWIVISVILIVVVFLIWRFVRPMNIFVVAPAFERPISTMSDDILPIYSRLSAEQCRKCHETFFEEWQTTIHSQAWTDPYFQVDWRFDGEQQICKNCHTPLDRQQEYLVLGFNDSEKLDPILKPNPGYDKKLQHEGVTCAACHYRDGKIQGVLGLQSAPHPVNKIDDPNELCVRCHIVPGDRWDTFYKVPPCGTVAELRHAKTDGPVISKAGEHIVLDEKSLNCVECHMPLVERPLVKGGEIRTVRQHLWRGGHDVDKVKEALTAAFVKLPSSTNDNPDKFELQLANTGAGHYFPTGTPDRHLTVEFSLLDQQGNIIEQEKHVLKRTLMWRPFIVDLWDTRLKHGESRKYTIQLPKDNDAINAVQVEVKYHLLHEKRRELIGYNNESPINYVIYQKSIPIFSDKNVVLFNSDTDKK